MLLVLSYILVGDLKTGSYSQYAGQVTSLTGWYERPHRKCRGQGNLKTMDLDKLETLIRELSVFD